MKTKYKIVVAIVAFFTFILFSAIFSDWDNFKAGLLGKPEVMEVQDKN